MLHNDKATTADDQIVTLNLAGHSCNFVSVPLLEDEEKVQDNLEGFMYQAPGYSDLLDYPMFYEEALLSPSAEANSNAEKYLNSEFKQVLRQVRKNPHIQAVLALATISSTLLHIVPSKSYPIEAVLEISVSFAKSAHLMDIFSFDKS